jgi:hypothetical protein
MNPAWSAPGSMRRAMTGKPRPWMRVRRATPAAGSTISSASMTTASTRLSSRRMAPRTSGEMKHQALSSLQMRSWSMLAAQLLRSTTSKRRTRRRIPDDGDAVGTTRPPPRSAADRCAGSSGETKQVTPS